MSETNNPSAGDSSEGENLQEVEGHLIAPEAAMVTEAEEGDTSLRRTLGVKQVGSVMYGREVLKSVFQEDKREDEGTCVPEDLLILPKVIPDASESKGKFHQDAKKATTQTKSYYLGPPDPEGNINWEQAKRAINCDIIDDKFFIPQTSSVDVDARASSLLGGKWLKTVFPGTDVIHYPTPDSTYTEDFRKKGKGLLSVFEKECPSWKKFVNMKISDLLAKTEESYLTMSNKNVKRVDILNPDYNLSSNNYEPMVGIVGKRYQIIIDVSLFDTENIVVHVVSDRVNVYARQQHEDKEGYESAEFHKVYKVPKIANKDRFIAHMLNPFKLLCICAPVELLGQDKEISTEMDT